MPSEKKTVKEERILPFYNLSFEKQIDVVKAYVAFYDKKKKPAHYKDVASIAGVHHTQASGCRKFWRSLGILEEKDGVDIPTKVALEFVRKLEWSKENEAWKLFRNHIVNTWFVSHVTMALKLQKTMSDDELMNSLGSAAGVHRKDPHIIDSLRILLELLIRSGIVKEDEETKKFMLHPELTKEAEPLIIPEKEENLIPIIIGDERYVVSPQELKDFVKEHGKKVASKEYVIRS
jgi:predicted transcriptional regulator